MTIIFTLPTAVYGPVNHLKTGTYIPALGTDEIDVFITIGSVDAADTSKSLTAFMEVSRDNGASFVIASTIFTWQGGTLDKHGNVVTNPAFGFGVRDFAGKQCRLDITAPAALNMGATVQTSP